ncbi:50S ribosomal protein L35 [Candidatus Karelsulcia muelleri]
MKVKTHKLKRKSSYKKRFKITSHGFIKRKKAFKNHILTKKATKRKRRLSHWALINNSLKKAIKKQFLF